jgi:uncharacterized membrane protein YesL
LRSRDRFWDQLDILGTFVLANLLWVIMSVPLITMPLATVGLFQIASKRVRGKEPEFFQDFFSAMRRYWAQSMVIGLIDALAGGIVVMNLSILVTMDSTNPLAVLSWCTTLFVGLVLLLANLYIWSLLVVVEEPVSQIIKISLKLVVVHPLWSLGVLIAASLPFVVGLVLPLAVLLFASISLSALIINRGTWHIIRRYLSEDELRSLETNHT